MMAQTVAEQKSTTGPANCDPKNSRLASTSVTSAGLSRRELFLFLLVLNIFVLEPDIILASSVFESQSHA